MFRQFTKNINQEFFAFGRRRCDTRSQIPNVTAARIIRYSSAFASRRRERERTQLTRMKGGGVQTVHERLTAFTASLIRFYNHEANHARAFSRFGGLYELPTRALLSAAALARGASVVTDITVVSRRALTTLALIFLSRYNAKIHRSLEEIKKDGGSRRYCTMSLFGKRSILESYNCKKVSYLYSHCIKYAVVQ